MPGDDNTALIMEKSIPYEQSIVYNAKKSEALDKNEVKIADWSCRHDSKVKNLRKTINK